MTKTEPCGGRLIVDWSANAAWNMAVDEAILKSVSAQTQSTVLRFYSWKTATLSLGYFQSKNLCPKELTQIARVRRSTGGGAIVHHHELTYSLTVATGPGEHGARHDLYRGIHQVIANEFGTYAIDARPHRLEKNRPNPSGGFLCFQRRTDEDLIVCGYKVVGSAQRRAKGAVLQHGSLLLKASPYAPELPGLSDLSSQAISPSELANGLADRIGKLLGIHWRLSELSATERESAAQIETQKYGSPEWWTKR